VAVDGRRRQISGPQMAQGFDERSERHRTRTKLEASAGKDERAGGLGTVGVLADQPALAHPGIAAEETEEDVGLALGDPAVEDG
jgi:hypothetical protein